MQGVSESAIDITPVDQEEESLAVERASTGKRTVVIVLAQVVALALIAVVWSIMRSRRSTV